MTKLLEKFWFPVVSLLLLIFLFGLALFMQRQPLPHALEIIQKDSQVDGELSFYIDGAVDRPGWYSFNRDDSLEKALRSAGIKGEIAETTKIKIHVPATGELKETISQKTNINTSSSEMLQALPHIGPALAARIITYRTEKGPFKNINELTRVQGIGPATLGKIKDLITVE